MPKMEIEIFIRAPYEIGHEIIALVVSLKISCAKLVQEAELSRCHARWATLTFVTSGLH